MYCKFTIPFWEYSIRWPIFYWTNKGNYWWGSHAELRRSMMGGSLRTSLWQAQTRGVYFPGRSPPAVGSGYPLILRGALATRPVSATILNASRNKKPPVRTQAAGKKEAHVMRLYKTLTLFDHSNHLHIRNSHICIF